MIGLDAPLSISIGTSQPSTSTWIFSGVFIQRETPRRLMAPRSPPPLP